MPKAVHSTGEPNEDGVRITTTVGGDCLGFVDRFQRTPRCGPCKDLGSSRNTRKKFERMASVLKVLETLSLPEIGNTHFKDLRAMVKLNVAEKIYNYPQARHQLVEQVKVYIKFFESARNTATVLEKYGIKMCSLNWHRHWCRCLFDGPWCSVAQ